MARPPPRSVGSEDVNMLGGVSSQRVEVPFNTLSGRFIQAEHLSGAYQGSPGGPRRGDLNRKFRPTGESKVYGNEREQFIQSSERSLHGRNNAIYSAVEREGGSAEGHRIVNGSPHVGVANTSVRVQDWAGSERRKLVREADYRETEERGAASSGSQSEGSEEEDEEDDGDMDGEEEADIGEQQRVGSILEQRVGSQKVYSTLSHAQMGFMDGRHESVASMQSSEGVQKGKCDRERVSKVSASSSPSLGMFLSPSSTIPFLNSFSSSQSVAPISAQENANPTQNGSIVAGAGPGAPSSSYRDSMIQETGLSRDSYVRESSNSFHEPARLTQGSSLHDALPVVPVTENENYYTSLLHSSGAIIPKDSAEEVGTFSHKRSNETVDKSLRAILSDPVTGALMEDATILFCGHSFGSDSLQRILETNVCISCGATTKREDMAPNHALRSVVHAFQREEELWKSNSSKLAKRRRDRLEKDRLTSGEQTSLEVYRARGVQFPYVVGDRVLIKGNKRTPERFVGREAVITIQCLNGWYVVRTLDNGESVKLQYRSLMKLGDQQSSNELQAKVMGPNWL